MTSTGKTEAGITRGRLLAGALALAALAAVVFFVCTFLGPVRLSLEGAPPWANQVWRMRALRLLAAAVAGGGLAAAGAAIQGLLRNPLAEPYVLGISSGAAVGVRIGLALPAVFGALAFRLPALAFAGALAACVAVYAIAQRRGRLDPHSLILSGVIINLFNGALVMLIYLLVDPFRVDEFARWAMGELPDAVNPALLAVCAALVLGGTAYAFRRAAALNAMGLGDDVARSLGVPVGRLRTEIFALAGLLTAAAVALAGPVSFVGLIVPHLCRLCGGPDHRRLVLYGALSGAVLLMAADTLCRTLGPAVGLGRVPVGVFTALLGGPFFLALLRRRYDAEDAA